MRTMLSLMQDQVEFQAVLKQALGNDVVGNVRKAMWSERVRLKVKAACKELVAELSPKAVAFHVDVFKSRATNLILDRDSDTFQDDLQRLDGLDGLDLSRAIAHNSFCERCVA